MDYVDLYQIHWPNHDVPLADTVGALERLKEQGKIRAIGVSNFAVRDLADVTALTHIETDQLPYSLLWRVIEREIQPVLVEAGIGIICYSSLAQGLLTGRYRDADEVPEGLTQSRWYSSERPRGGHGEPGVETEVFTALDRLRALAAETGLSMATLSLAWVKAPAGCHLLPRRSAEPRGAGLEHPGRRCDAHGRRHRAALRDHRPGQGQARHEPGHVGRPGPDALTRPPRRQGV